MIRFIFFFLLCPLLLLSQTKNFTGVVSDTLNIPLESAGVIARSLQEKAQLKFGIVDNTVKSKVFTKLYEILTKI